MNTAPLIPPWLRPGDTIAVFYPAGPVRKRSDFEAGLTALQDFGLKIVHSVPDGSGPEYLAAEDTIRVAEIHRLFRDENIKGLIAARGGFGCLRLINQLDFKLICSRPKWLIGFSDLTVLLNGFFSHTGIITLHGPVVTSFAHTGRASQKTFINFISGTCPGYHHIHGLEVLRGGDGRGALVGGNLTTLTHLIGTPWQPRFAQSILFLEDTAEPAYKLDRMLTHLAASGILDNLSGLILGMFDPGHDDPLETLRLNEEIWNRALDLTRSFQYPVWGGFPVGHQRQNYVLPVGLRTFMESNDASIFFEIESCQLCSI